MNFVDKPGNLEDFWGRRVAAPKFDRTDDIFGHELVVRSNEEGVLTAVSHSLPLFSRVNTPKTSPFAIQLIVEGRMSHTPAPPDLMRHITYTGDAHWLMLHLGQWGHAHVDLERKVATAVLVPGFASQPELVSRCLLNTVLLNFCIHAGYGMLHASCLVKNGRLLLLLAPHNTGKSTTALHLALAGYQFVSDSMVFVWAKGEQVQITAFPVGRTKLRTDMVPQFPQLQPYLIPEVIRTETKYSLDLGQLGEQFVQKSAVYPQTAELYLMSRSQQPETTITPASETAVWQAVLANSLYEEKTAVWQQNLSQIQTLLQKTTSYHLQLGTDPAKMIAAFTAPPIAV